MPNYSIAAFIMAITLLLFTSLTLGSLLVKIKFPRVIGELGAGIILGPSVLGYYFPELFSQIFKAYPSQAETIRVLEWLGLIFLMLMTGVKFPLAHLREDIVKILLLTIAGLIIPLLAGMLLSQHLSNTLETDPIAFTTVIAVAASITSIPVLSRIFMDLDIMGTGFARNVISAASIQDMILWALVSFALTLHFKNFSGTATFKIFFINSALLVIFLVSAYCLFISVWHISKRTKLKAFVSEMLLGFVVLGALVLINLANLMNVNLILSSLLAGVIIGQLPGRKCTEVVNSISSVSSSFFTPLYFAIVGLQLDLPNHLDFQMTSIFIVVTTIVKITSVFIFLRPVTYSSMQAFDYGIAMNARGGPGIVLASVAFAAGIIDDSLFVCLVCSAILTSLFAGLWLAIRRDRIT